MCTTDDEVCRLRNMFCKIKYIVFNIKNKTKLIGNTFIQPALNAANVILKHATTTGPLKYLSNFLRSLEIPLINCKVELRLKWTKCCLFLQLVMKLKVIMITIIIVIISFLLSKTQSYMFLL